MKRSKILLLAGLLFSVSSCVRFEKQTLVFRYDPGTDRLRIFQVYEGIFGEKSADALSDQEKEEIQSVLDGQRTFFFANWIFEYTRAVAEEFIEEATRKPEDEKKRPGEFEIQKEGLPLARLLLANAEVRNGGFFMNQENKLSGYQLVTLSNASKVVAQANRLIGAAYKEYARRFKEGHDEGLTEETVRLIAAAARRGHSWITLEKNCISFRLPFAYRNFKKLRAAGADSLAALLEKGDFGVPGLRGQLRVLVQLLRSDAWVSYTDDMVVFTLGHPSCSRAEVSLDLGGPPYKPNMVSFAREHGGVADSIDLEERMAGFFGDEPR